MKKVKCKNEIEFVRAVADDCVKNLSEKYKNYLISNPYSIEYHFSYCLYIRNHYIHNRDFSEAPFWAEPDHLSSQIIRMIFDKLLPEYSYYDVFTRYLYDSKTFIQLRKEYHRKYAEYPVNLVEKYKKSSSLKQTYTPSEDQLEPDIDSDGKLIEVDYKIISDEIDSLIHELAELVGDEKESR